MASGTEIEARYNTAPQEDNAYRKMVRESFAELAHHINYHLPEGREKALAMTALDQAALWSDAALTR